MLDSKQTKPLSWLNELDLAINRGDLSSLALLQSGVAAVWLAQLQKNNYAAAFAESCFII